VSLPSKGPLQAVALVFPIETLVRLQATLEVELVVVVLEVVLPVLLVLVLLPSH
jgi:hypothetical protein